MPGGGTIDGGVLGNKSSFGLLVVKTGVLSIESYCCRLLIVFTQPYFGVLLTLQEYQLDHFRQHVRSRRRPVLRH